jgi:hypothetical protein
LIYAKVICDSVSPIGNRITSVEVQFPRFILPQVLMHRQWSRSCESLRARPTKSKVAEVSWSPVIPVFAANKKGMSAGEVLPPEVQEKVRAIWLGAMEQSVAAAEELHQLGVAKQWANRLLEPFAYQKVLVTATDFANFLRLRCADDAQPEIQELAVCMRDALADSDPVKRSWVEWHLPYYEPEDDERLASLFTVAAEEAVSYCRQKVSAARCARVSYNNHNGERDVVKDLRLADNLLESAHSNVFEHQCLPTATSERYANLRGWVSYRYVLEQSDLLPNAEG